jgi:DnaJ family protein C protein 28
MADQDKQETNPRKRVNLVNFESAIDQQIREAMERGDFNNLKGAGKPLNLARDPNVPEDWELAFNVLKNAGYAPDWIETLNSVRKEQDKLFAPLNRFLANPPALPDERARRQMELIEQFRKDAKTLNGVIDTFNLKAPADQVHLRRIRIDEEIEKFLGNAK